jgi:hypothetical protein
MLNKLSNTLSLKNLNKFEYKFILYYFMYFFFKYIFIKSLILYYVFHLLLEKFILWKYYIFKYFNTIINIYQFYMLHFLISSQFYFFHINSILLLT